MAAVSRGCSPQIENKENDKNEENEANDSGGSESYDEDDGERQKRKRRHLLVGGSEKLTDSKGKTPMVRWTNEEISNLIDEYEARSCLWDVFSPQYHNREVTGKAKKELEVRVNADKIEKLIIIYGFDASQPFFFKIKTLQRRQEHYTNRLNFDLSSSRMNFFKNCTCSCHPPLLYLKKQ